ncbi:MAG: 16S rRNA (cytidine(1402)-2'-O)-methyltransferase [Candidatus Gastranaerophilales bacterium]|nr:16S rRNA (cytidine(1402)-2'-O)-methyltransferase [Candidatus Gastranaerophilales bacterium]
MENASFYVVATPIGNLKDITLRALEVLKSVDYVACEDTRVTKKLLERYDINANLFDYHKFNERQCSEKIINFLQNGQSVALVSDAGTPGVSDPGCVLFDELEKCNIKINMIPGASAITTFLSGVSRDEEPFAFAGFLPKTEKQLEDCLLKYKNINTVFYESPNRLLETLKAVKIVRGGDVIVAIGRELTKVYEEVKKGTVDEIIGYFSSNVLKGEIVGMIYKEKTHDVDYSELFEKVSLLKKEDFSDKDITKILVSLFDVNKNKLKKILINGIK